MNVANIIEEARVGGPQIRIVRVAQSMKKLGVKTIVFMPKKNSKDLNNLCKKNELQVEFLEIANVGKKLFTILKYLLFFIFDIFEIKKKIEKYNIDLIHVSGGSWQIKGIIVGKLLKIPTIWHINDTYMPWIILKVFKLLNTYVDGFIFASRKSLLTYQIKKKIPYTVIPSTLDTNFFYKAAVKKKKLFNSKLLKKRLVVTVANISPVKNLECLIYSLKHVKNSIKNIHFLIVGDTFESQLAYKKKILDLVKKLNLNQNISFLGKKKDIRYFLKISEIYVCSSNFESSPISIWEAMSMELPIISTNVGDLKKFIRNDKNGYLVKKNDYINISKKINFLMLNKKKMRKFGKINRKLVVNNFSLDIISKKTINFYNSILNVKS